MPSLFLLLLPDALAQSVQTESAPTLGLGGATRANPVQLEAAVRSPAILPLAETYAFTVSGAAVPDGGWGIRVEGVDSKTSPLTLGLAYARETAEPDTATSDLPGWMGPDDEVETDPQVRSVLAISGAGTNATRQVGVGVNLVRLHRESKFGGVESTWNGGIGVSGRPHSQVTVSLSALNLLPTDADLGVRNAALASRVQTPGGTASIEADVTAQLEDISDPGMGFAVGGHVNAGPAPIRLGIERQPGQTHLGAGFGYAAEQVGIDYGFRTNLSAESVRVWGTGAWHAVSLRFFM